MAAAMMPARYPWMLGRPAVFEVIRRTRRSQHEEIAEEPGREHSSSRPGWTGADQPTARTQQTAGGAPDSETERRVHDRAVEAVADLQREPENHGTERDERTIDRREASPRSTQGRGTPPENIIRRPRPCARESGRSIPTDPYGNL